MGCMGWAGVDGATRAGGWSDGDAVGADVVVGKGGLGRLLLHAASSRNAVPSAVQPLPSMAMRQSRVAAPLMRTRLRRMQCSDALRSKTYAMRACARILARNAPPGRNERALYQPTGRSDRALHNAAYPAQRFSRTIASCPKKLTSRMSDSSSLAGSNAFYSSAPIQSLFARELRALAPIVSGVYGNYGLFLHAHAAASIAPPAHLLGTMVSLDLVQQQLAGDLRCEPAQLPFASESFKLLIAQHVYEQIDRPDECAAELSRVLAPEGVVLILGFNPLGLWRPWLMLNAPRGGSRLHLRSAHAWQQMLAREQVDTLQVRYPGVLWPCAEHAQVDAESALLGRMLGRIGSSWLLLARKRRSTLTPLRLRSGARELVLNPQLAPGAHRARA